MKIDLRTLILIIGILHLMQLLIFIHQYKVNSYLKGPGWWLAWSGIETIGFGFILLRNIPSLVPIIMLFQDIIILTGTVFVYIGILKFLYRSINWRFIAIFLTSFSALHLIFIFVNNDIRMRTLIFDIYLSIISFVTAFALYKNKNQSIAASINFNTTIFIAHGCIFLYRSIMIILGTRVDDVFSPSLFNLVQYFDALIVGLLWTVGFIIMLNQRLNAEILETKTHFEQIFNTSPDAALITRLDNGLLVNFNDNFLKVFGYTKEFLKGKTTLDIKMWNDSNDRSELINLLNEKGYVENYEAAMLKKNGELIHGLISAKSITLKGEPHLISVTRDISYRKQLEMEMQRKNVELKKLSADKDRFISILAHDLKSPFNTILGYLDLLNENIENYDTHKIKNKISIINNSAQIAFNLLDDILLWASSQSGKIPFEPKELKYNDICKTILLEMRFLADTKRIDIRYNSEEDVAIFADIDMLKTILRNLISNAIKFTNQAGNIIISIKQEPDSQIISVSDDGVGMVPEILNKLFTNSRMGSTKGTDNERGTGLGLSLCKEFVEKHGGKIWAESKPGKGSTFYFSLPTKKGQAITSQSSEEDKQNIVR